MGDVCYPATLIFIVAATATTAALIVSYSYSEPHIYMQGLYVPSLVVPALNKTTTFNTSVFVDLKFERRAAFTRHHYKDFQITLVYDQDRSTRIPVGTHMVQGFGMGRKRRVHVKAAVEAVGMPWEEASRAVSVGNVVVMVVELMMSSDSDETPLMARVAVDASGHMVSKNPIEFRWPCGRRPCGSGKGVYCDYCI